MRHHIREFRRLAAIGQREHRVTLHDHAQVAMAGLAGVDEECGRAGRGHGGGDFTADMAGFAHAGDHHTAGAAGQEFHRGIETAIQTGGKRRESLRLQHQHIAAHILVGG